MRSPREGSSAVLVESEDRAFQRQGSPSLGAYLSPERWDSAAMQRLDDFAAFYDSGFASVRSAVALYSGDREIAWDATQEAFSRALVRWRRLRSEPWATGWVMTTAMNLARRELRRRGGRARGMIEPGATPGPEPDAVRRMDLSRALKALPARRRQAVVLYYVGDLSVHAIAELMGLSESAVRAHLSNARRDLKNVFQQDPEATQGRD